jgi:MOSC domain-containing protein
MVKVARISIAPVKGLGLVHPEEVLLGRSGVPNDRRFYLVDPSGRLVNNKTCGELMQVRPEVSEDALRLTLAFPSGEVVGGDVTLGDAVETSFYGRPITGRFVDGPWSEALSAHAGRPLRVVRTDEHGAAIDRTHVVSVISGGSLAALGRRAGVDRVDGRRFRMTIELEGGEEHEEDAWIGGEAAVGAARIRVTGTVGRCVVTTRNPDTGVSDFDTLGVLAGYRTLREGKSFGCGVCGDVLEAGAVRVGDSLVAGH